jgi:hypothetical protein
VRTPDQPVLEAEGTDDLRGAGDEGNDTGHQAGLLP